MTTRDRSEKTKAALPFSSRGVCRLVLQFAFDAARVHTDGAEKHDRAECVLLRSSVLPTAVDATSRFDKSCGRFFMKMQQWCSVVH